jgi:hypothetical protein
VIALAAVSVAVGVLLGVLTMQRLAVGETWHDWQIVESPRWFTALQAVLIAMLFGGVFVPGELAAVLIGIPIGFCLVPFTIGIRRRFGRDTRPARDPELEAEIEAELYPPESWRSRVGWFAATLAVSFVAGYLIVDLRGLELVGVAVGITVLVILTERLQERIGRWLR